MEDLEKETPKTEEEINAPAAGAPAAGDEKPEEKSEEKPEVGAFKFNLAFAASFAGALLIFFIELGFGKVSYGLAAFAFIGMCVQFAEFYLKTKKIPVLVTACLAGAAALTMLILSIVALCVT